MGTHQLKELKRLQKKNERLRKAVSDQTRNGMAFHTLNILHEFSRGCLMIRVRRKLSSANVADLTDLFIPRGPPELIR